MGNWGLVAFSWKKIKQKSFQGTQLFSVILSLAPFLSLPSSLSDYPAGVGEALNVFIIKDSRLAGLTVVTWPPWSRRLRALWQLQPEHCNSRAWDGRGAVHWTREYTAFASPPLPAPLLLPELQVAWAGQLQAEVLRASRKASFSPPRNHQARSAALSGPWHPRRARPHGPRRAPRPLNLPCALSPQVPAPVESSCSRWRPGCGQWGVAWGRCCARGRRKNPRALSTRAWRTTWKTPRTPLRYPRLRRSGGARCAGGSALLNFALLHSRFPSGQHSGGRTRRGEGCLLRVWVQSKTGPSQDVGSPETALFRRPRGAVSALSFPCAFFFGLLLRVMGGGSLEIYPQSILGVWQNQQTA